MTELVFKGQNDQVLTNSLLVAQTFGKEHKHVLDAINNLFNTAENSALLSMFDKSTYIAENGKGNPMFIMNRDGFTLLAMGFTGKKAMNFKLEYINAFNQMEKTLKEQQKPLSQLEILVASAQALLEQNKRIENVENRLDAMEQEREENGKALLAISISSTRIPEMSVRDKIRQLVNAYSSATNISQQDIWHKIYSKLYYLYHISIKNYKKAKNESNLDVAEKNGFIDKLYIIISDLVREQKAA